MHVHQNDSTSGARWKSSEKEQEKPQVKPDDDAAKTSSATDPVLHAGTSIKTATTNIEPLLQGVDSKPAPMLENAASLVKDSSSQVIPLVHKEQFKSMGQGGVPQTADVQRNLSPFTTQKALEAQEVKEAESKVKHDRQVILSLGTTTTNEGLTNKAKGNHLGY